MSHDIDVVYYPCNVKDCIYKPKSSSDLKKHKANIHEIDVVYYTCNAKRCKYKAKGSGDLKKHKAAIHGNV